MDPRVKPAGDSREEARRGCNRIKSFSDFIW
jgi:hypothetical protein